MFDFEPWQAWLAVAVLLGVAELLSLDLFLLMLAAGALVGMGADLLGAPGWLQVLSAAGASVAALGLVRPAVVRRMQSGPQLVLGHDALVGRQGLVLQRVTAEGGRIRIGGEEWTARPYDEDGVIEVGSRVDVLQIKGATALVHEIPQLGPGD
ncbi:MAG: NfeD family protein [Nocardioidaceae bacterium]